MSKFQLHATSLESLARCGIAFERRHILGDKRPGSARMHIGTAVDRSVRTNLQAKIDTGAPAPVEEVRAIARDTLVQAWAEGVLVDENDTDDGTASKDKAIDTSVTLAGLHHRVVAPTINPTHVARKWVLDIDGIWVQLAGEIDIQEGRHMIRDTKTSAKSPVKEIADTSLQLSSYVLAVRQCDGYMVDQVGLDYLVQTPKRGDTKFVQLTSTRTEASLQPMLERIAHMSRIIESGAFTPAPADSWWCSARWCAYHSDCKYAVRPLSVAVDGEKEPARAT